MIVVNEHKIEINGNLGDCMIDSVRIVEAIKDAAWSIIDKEEDPESANNLIRELTVWATEIIDAVMPDTER